MGDARPDDHDHPALAHDLPDHVGNVDEFPPVDSTGYVLPDGRYVIGRDAYEAEMVKLVFKDAWP